MERELKQDEQASDDEINVGPVRSKVVTANDAKVVDETVSANIEDLEEPKLEEPMEDFEGEEKDAVKVRVESPADRTAQVQVKKNRRDAQKSRLSENLAI